MEPGTRPIMIARRVACEQGYLSPLLSWTAGSEEPSSSSAFESERFLEGQVLPTTTAAPPDEGPSNSNAPGHEPGTSAQYHLSKKN